MAIYQSNVIDYMSTTEDKRILHLFMTDHLQWRKKYDMQHLYQIQRKLNNYLAYAESGEYMEKYPFDELEECHIIIKLLFPPSKAAEKFFKQAAEQIHTQNPLISLLVEIDSDEDRAEQASDIDELSDDDVAELYQFDEDE